MSVKLRKNFLLIGGRANPISQQEERNAPSARRKKSLTEPLPEASVFRRIRSLFSFLVLYIERRGKSKGQCLPRVIWQRQRLFWKRNETSRSWSERLLFCRAGTEFFHKSPELSWLGVILVVKGDLGVRMEGPFLLPPILQHHEISVCRINHARESEQHPYNFKFPPGFNWKGVMDLERPRKQRRSLDAMVRMNSKLFCSKRKMIVH